MYHNPSFVPPTRERLRQIAVGLGFDISDGDLQQYKDCIAGYAASCDVLDKYVEPILPVKYPRTPGYRPPAEENSHNAWLYKSDIAGAKTGKLVGKRVVIKDVIPVAGVPLLYGCSFMSGYTPDFDATVITRILDAGGHIVGKSTCESLCGSSGSHTSSTGPVLNPRDPSRSCGGSSSGNAALLVLGEADMAIGTDQGGSIRTPAGMTGTVGLKPTYGLVPYTGIGTLRQSVDHMGPMANTVEDCALMLEVLAGFDEGLDPRQSRDVPLMADVPEYSAHVNDSLVGLNVAILTEGMADAEGDVVALVRQRSQQLESLGVTVDEVSIPMHEDGVHIWKTAGWQGKYLTCSKEPEQYGLRYYAKSQNLERVLRGAYDKTLTSYDALIMPTTKFKPRHFPSFDAGPKEVIGHTKDMESNVSVFCLTGHPAISVNAGYSQKLPVGLMVVGRHFDDVTVLKVARGIERLREMEA